MGVFQSSFGCPVSGGVGKGWVFVILMIAVSMVYLAGGIAYKRYKFGMSGAEAIPHVDFWRDVPKYMKDGIVFSTGWIKSKISRVGNYSKVESFTVFARSVANAACQRDDKLRLIAPFFRGSFFGA